MKVNESIEWGMRSKKSGFKYRPIAISCMFFLITLVCDILLVASLAEESFAVWLWALAVAACFAMFIASLKSDYFKVLHYVVDHAGVHLQYEVTKGPLETSKLVQRMQSWSAVKSANYSTHSVDDDAEVRRGVMLTLNGPLEGGRTNVELRSDRPEQLMAYVGSQLNPSQVLKRNPDAALAIA
jgi:hypothetical protein